MKPPEKLYKYCSINPNSLRAIVRSQVFHPPPVQFNDPLDCNPSLELDISAHQLETLLRKMLADEGILDGDIQHEIDKIAYFTVDPELSDNGPAFDEAYSFQLGEEIKRFLRKDHGLKGVLALSERWDEPLMWSHYAAQHQGICIEYKTSGFPIERLKPVNYNAPRALRAHDIFRWKCHGDAQAEQRVFDTYFYSKAPQWSYEVEWRDIADKAGVNPSHVELTAIHLGMRVDFVWKWLLVKALHRDKQVTLYEVDAEEKTFKLTRRVMSRDELERRGIDQPAFKVFGNIDLNNEIVRALYVGDGDKTKG